jgi:exo-1,4-beta-D-glucosaminidase
MLNNAWPSLIWHLWDHSLRTAGGYFGTKKACEPLHIQYDAGENTVSIVSELPEATPALRALIRLVDASGTERYRYEAVVAVPADGVVTLCELPSRAELGRTHFLHLMLLDPNGRARSRNFYWLSTDADVIDQANANWYMAPLEGFASFHALAELPVPQLMLERRAAGVRIHNGGTSLAFFIELRVRTAQGAEVLPTYFSDNYFSLLPGESAEVTIQTPKRSPGPLELVALARGAMLARLQL